MIDLRTEIREFPGSRRARLTPERAGLPAYGVNRRVKGVRREEVALLAGVSVDYYVRMERGSLAGASDGVLDAVVDAPAWICDGRYDVLAANRLAAALCSPVLADARRPANTARFVCLESEAAGAFFVDYERVARDVAAKLRMEAGRDPHDEDLIALVGELSTRSALFRRRWASRDVRLHRSGRKRLRHPVVGELDLDVESMGLPANPGLLLTVHTAPAGTASADGLALLASWAAGRESGVRAFG